MTARRRVAVLLGQHGRTFAGDAGVHTDEPGPLYQLLVLVTLLSARITATVAVAAARELFAAGFRSPRAMLDMSWQDPGRCAGPWSLPPARFRDFHYARRRCLPVPGALAG